MTGSTLSPDGSVDHAELCECGDPRWKHRHDVSCLNQACNCIRFRAAGVERG